MDFIQMLTQVNNEIEQLPDEHVMVQPGIVHATFPTFQTQNDHTSFTKYDFRRCRSYPVKEFVRQHYVQHNRVRFHVTGFSCWAKVVYNYNHIYFITCNIYTYIYFYYQIKS
jgi:hypothetical protein